MKSCCKGDFQGGLAPEAVCLLLLKHAGPLRWHWHKWISIKTYGLNSQQKYILKVLISKIRHRSGAALSATASPKDDDIAVIDDDIAADVEAVNDDAFKAEAQGKFPN